MEKSSKMALLAPVWPVFLLLLLVCGPVRSQQMIDKVVAIVGGEVILLSEVQGRAQFYAIQNRLDPKSTEVMKTVLDFMINERLVLAKAIEDSVIVTDDEVRQQLDERIKEVVQQYGSEARVEELYGMSIGRMRREFRDEMKKELLKSKLQRQTFGNITVTRREVEEFFKEYRDSLPDVPQEVEVSHIFVRPKIGTEVKRATYEKAKAILDSLRTGADFASLAKKYSDDLGSSGHGGDLGWARRGDFLKEFEEATFALKEGQISDVVETSLGYHIIQLLERRGDAVHPRQILIRMERRQADDDSTIAFLKELKSQAEAGTSFAELARKYSEDEESAFLGGDLGRLTIDQLQPDFLSTVDSLSPGEISNPEKVMMSEGHGYHIVLLRKRIPPHKIDPSQDWKRVEQYAIIFKRNKEYAQWLEELRKSIYWETRL